MGPTRARGLVRALRWRRIHLIRAVQRKLSLTADGLLGPATIRALQKHLGVAQDSWFGPGTARALQSRLNTGRF